MIMRYLGVLAVAISVLSGPAAAAGAKPYKWGAYNAQNSSLTGFKKKSYASKKSKSVALASGGPKVAIAASAPPIVKIKTGYKKGSVVIDTAGRKLYYVVGKDKAYAYPVAVGKKGFTWSGTEKVSKVVDWPSWTPPEEMRQRKPGLPLKMTGGVKNPLGVKAIYLGNSLYRIHGTNAPESIGTAASSGCIRMHNGHVVHLSKLVSRGTTVHVVKKIRA